MLHGRHKGYSLRKSKVTIEDFRLWNLTHDEWFDYLSYSIKNQNMECSKCGSWEFYGPSKRRLFECKKCGYQGSITSGTIMDKTRVSLDKWFLLFFMVYQEGDNLSVVQVRDELGVSYPTAKLLLEKTKENNDISYWLDTTRRFIYNRVDDMKKELKIEGRFEVFNNKKDDYSLWFRELVFNKNTEPSFLLTDH
jgi:transposase-like protein